MASSINTSIKDSEMGMDTRDTGRLAGALYLLVVVTGMYSLAYVPSQLNVVGDPQSTLNRIVASESLFRSGVAAFMVMQVAFLLLPFALYRLFAPTNRTMAVLMVALAVVSVPIGFSALAHRLNALSLLTDPAAASLLTQAQARVAASLSLDAYRNGLQVTKLFWGLWLLPFGLLVLQSRRLPKFLGVLLILGCFGYLVQVFGNLLLPAYGDSGLARYVPLPAAIGEIGACLWLLLVGARTSVRLMPD
jgi:hypothetical protein